MILNLVIIAAIGYIGYTWVTRGFFSALLHAVCVLIGGAIGLALWEPTAYFFLSVAPTSGFFAFLEGLAWPAGLILPFAAATAILRVVSDSIVPANIKLPAAVDYAGAGVCGLLAGVITTGLVFTALGHARLASDLFGYGPVRAVNTGVQKEGGLWVPVDTVTGKIYAYLSDGVLSTPEPFARWHPDFDTAPAALRLSLGDGKARNVMPPDAVSVVDGWRVGGEGVTLSDLLARDAWSDARQQVAKIDGEPFAPQSQLVGYTLELAAQARENRGDIVVSAGQVRLVVEKASTGERAALHPIAAVSAADGEASPPVYGRWRYDGKFHLASVGSASQTFMGFEFVLEPGYEPVGLTIKNTRLDVSGIELKTYASAPARDSAIQTGAILGGRGEAGELDDSDAERVTSGGSAGGRSEDIGIRVSRTLPFRMTIQKGTHRGLDLQGNEIMGGREAFDPAIIQGARGIDRNLQIRQFVEAPGSVLVHVDVGLRSPQSLLGRAAASAQRIVPPVLIDTNGQRYEAIGYVYQDEEIVRMRFTPGEPIRGLSQIEDEGVSMSRSASGQELVLLFRVSIGADIERFAIGNRVIAEYDPPIDAVGR